MILFTPHRKVQKDRSIMRDTDSRLARLSGRGLIVNVATYFLCLSIGDLAVVATHTTVVLSTGLLLTALCRSYFIMRFEHIYNSGPTRWRNYFFAATLIGAGWWSVILVTATLTLGMTGETPLLWIYTIIFFAITIHSTAPYRVFSQVYLLLTLLPAVLAAFYVGGVLGYMYSLMMLIFLGLLLQLLNSINHGYWGRLEAISAIRQKAIDLEVEKRDVDASVDLNSEFLISLGHEFRTSLNDILGSLSLLTDSTLDAHQQDLLHLAQRAGERQLDLVNNIAVFSRINNRTLVLDHNVFNLRAQLDLWVNDLADNAHQQGVEIDYYIHKAVPLRVTGDAKRIAQVYKNLLNNAVQFSEEGSIFIDINFRWENESKGRLEVTMTDRLDPRQIANAPANVSATAIAEQSKVEQSKVEQSKPQLPGVDQPKVEPVEETPLWLTICKGLSECMGGSIDIDNSEVQETQYRFRLPLTVTQPASRLVSQPKLRDKKVLILTPDLPISRYHLQLMRDWGLVVDQAMNYEQAFQRLKRSQERTGGPGYHLVVINLHRHVEKALAFSHRLLQLFPEAPLPQLYLLAYNHLNEQPVRLLVDEHPSVAFYYRPISPQSFHDQIAYCILGKPLTDELIVEPENPTAHKCNVLVVDDHRVNQMIAQSMLKKLGYRVILAGHGLEALKEYQSRRIDLILMDCLMPEMDGFETTKRIRQLETEAGEAGKAKHVPIIAMTAQIGEDDQSRCFAYGMDDYIAKPVKFDVLQERLRHWLGSPVKPVATLAD